MAITDPKFGTTPNKDSTYRTLDNGYITPAYAATLAYTPIHHNTIYKPAALTGAVTLNLTVTSANVGDMFTYIASASGASRITTFGTGFVSAGTLTAADAKQVTAKFIFDGVKFVEISRFVQP
jgi:hypothetical protein